jgi:hypothetical protein
MKNRGAKLHGVEEKSPSEAVVKSWQALAAQLLPAWAWPVLPASPERRASTLVRR